MILLAIVSAVVLLDQATKLWAVAALTETFEMHQKKSFLEKVKGFYTIPTLGDFVSEDGKLNLRKPPHEVIPGFWNHRYVENPGSAWGLFANLDAKWREPFFHVVHLLAIVLIILYLRKLTPEQKGTAIALSFILGGAIGNYIDRLARGYVIDFIQWYWKDFYWPTFNIADSSLCIGVGIMLLEAFFLRPEKEAKPGQSSSNSA